MFIVSGRKIGRDLRSAYKILSHIKVPRTLRRQLVELRRSDVLVLVTDNYAPLDPPKRRYQGMMRRMLTHYVVAVPGDALYRPILILHELVHVVGGTELDAEAVEFLACEYTGHKPLITPEEIRTFRRLKSGRFMKWRW
jgi:hypothetical protein